VTTRIRLARGGKKKAPFYRIVVADSRSPRDGRYIERIGTFNPLRTENNITLDTARAQHWLDTGALPSDRVIKLLKMQGMEHKAFNALIFHEAKESKKAIEARAAEAAAKEAAAKEAAEKAAADKAAAEEAAAAEKAAAEAAASEPAAEETPAEETPAE